MEMDGLKDLITYTKEHFPKNAADIAVALDLLAMSLDDLCESASVQINRLLKAKGFDNVNAVVEKMKLVSSWRAIIAEYGDSLDLEAEDVQEDLEEENNPEQERRTIPDYSKYIVDDSIPHTLKEHYSHKRPAGFSLSGRRYDASDWRDVLVKTCNLLAARDAAKFKGLLYDPSMKGRKNAYFSTKSVPRKNVRLDSLDIYVWTNLSANHIRNNILLMLKKLGIPATEYTIYLRADYTTLHKTDDPPVTNLQA